MSICEFNFNVSDRCGNCKDFEKNNAYDIVGKCTSLHSRAKNKDYKSERSKACHWQRRIK